LFPHSEDEDESEDILKQSTGENIYPKEMSYQACRENSILRNLMIYKFTQYYEDDQMKKYERLWICK
jgi:hypothetical protein